MEKEQYNWKYKYEDEKFLVIPDKEFTKPETLFKFYDINKYSVNALINHYIYASHPSQLNDLFDCNENLFDFENENEVRIILHNFNKEITLSDDYELNKTSLKEYLKEWMYIKFGVISLTSDPGNIQMWTYYTNNQGFCVEFDYVNFPFQFQGPMPINYQKKLYPIVLKINELPLGPIYQSNIKHIDWQLEKEWRILAEAPRGETMFTPNYKTPDDSKLHDRKFYYQLDAIKSISLGNLFFAKDEMKEINNEVLEINLKNENTFKREILKFLANFEILTYIAMRSVTFELHFIKCKLQQLENNKFIINRLG